MALGDASTGAAIGGLSGVAATNARGKNGKAIEIAKNLLDVLDYEIISVKTGLNI